MSDASTLDTSLVLGSILPLNTLIDRSLSKNMDKKTAEIHGFLCTLENVRVLDEVIRRSGKERVIREFKNTDAEDTKGSHELFYESGKIDHPENYKYICDIKVSDILHRRDTFWIEAQTFYEQKGQRGEGFYNQATKPYQELRKIIHDEEVASLINKLDS